MSEEPRSSEPSEEQLLYARILSKGMLLGLLLLLITFAIYSSGVMKPGVPKDALANYWTMDSHQYLETVEENHLHMGHLCTGWSWLKLVGKSDYLNFVGIAILSAITILCYLAVVPTLLRKGDKVYAVIALLEAAVLALAASGILAVGH